MPKNYVIGFPRIGEQRELKRVLESYWAKEVPFSEVERVARELRERHWRYQSDAGIDCISCNDFSLYDNMLDTSVMLGAIP
ncbi:MAG: 5-methyltetrahydropteroyltriglutamate--homocysteine S-methyltransferase, partial [Epsilonproteobacteria bacterium]|nr:5-methyltetrahydropteroyltriglutamate--homocysteine S-methyltransferase [Campylobacterota bacterium]